MRYILFLILGSFLFIGGSCNPTGIIGAEDVTEYDGAKFVVTSKSAYSSYFRVQGTVENIGSNPFIPYWYIEGEFFADSTFKLKFGGDYTQMNYRLEPGEQTIWSIKYSHDDISESDYPNFGIKNLRAYRKED